MTSCSSGKMVEHLPNVVFVVLCGLPGAGKSLLCQELRKDLLAQASNKKPTVVLISYDTLIPDVKPFLWKQQRQDILSAVSHLVRQSSNFHNEEEKPLPPAVSVAGMLEIILTDNGLQNLPAVFLQPLIVIFDDNMYYRSMRYDVYQMAVALRTAYCQIFLNVDPKVAKERNDKRPFQVPDDVVERMRKVLEVPDGQKNHFERYTVMLGSPWTKKEFHSAIFFIETCLTRPVFCVDVAEERRIAEERNRDQEANKRNLIHFADLFLRNLVSEKGKMILSSSNFLDRMRLLNECRKNILQSVRLRSLDDFQLEMHREFLEIFLTTEFEQSLQNACQMGVVEKNLAE